MAQENRDDGGLVWDEQWNVHVSGDCDNPGLRVLAPGDMFDVPCNFNFRHEGSGAEVDLNRRVTIAVNDGKLYVHLSRLYGRVSFQYPIEAGPAETIGG
jgi:hypothetical protein